MVNKEYKKITIRIAFNPVDEKFEVLNPAIEKDKRWIDDISPIITNELRLSKVVNDFCALNEDVDRDKVEDVLEDLKSIVKKQIGLIELSGDLDIEKVTEIFIRINSHGVELSQADFVMSWILSTKPILGNSSWW